MMPTLKQLYFSSRTKKLNKTNSPKLNKNPQKKAICVRVLTISPKKPNSANRRVVKARVINSKIRLTAKVPGETHNLQQHSAVLVKGAKIKDLIGVSYAVIRGKYDLLGVSNRKTRRSIYGVKKTNQ
jgi:small subunit ribosomal protein S12|tara:strand:- start:853 stop:1233 length:381 start_codon:yes stop_codon:yes gene_type:complete